MTPVFYFIGCCALLGAVGMAIANRAADVIIRRQRWLKYFSYLVITTLVFTSIWLHFFLYVAATIVLAGCYELVRVLLLKPRPKSNTFVINGIFGYSFIATGFLVFAYIFKTPFLFSIYLQVLIFDAFCQITGQLFGRRKLVPNISPAKTVEGFAGGSIFCIVTALLFAGILSLPLLTLFYLGIITAISSLTGDLLASWLKRKLNIKDYSNLLPGQGGFLDRFDSLLMTGLVYTLLAGSLLKSVLSPFLLSEP